MADVGELTAKLTLDTADFDKGTSGVDGKLSKLTSGITKSLGKMSAAVGAAFAASAAAVGKAVYDSVNAFSEYEQLVGGSKLVFGDAYDFIADKASEAYKTVQMSQNEYLAQVNGFAVGLKTALGGNEQAAAELADRIINAEADIVAAMGVTQESVQNAFNGIMKSNYTMVDNLMLGIKPTKEGFQEMIDKVNEWNAAQGHATQYTMDNLADQQAALVDYIEMQGLAGYAAKEAGDTITGSLSMVKAAWKDVLVAVSGGGKGLTQAIENLVTSAKTFAKNIMPTLQTALQGIGDLLNGLVPIITDALPGLIDALLPQLLQTAVTLVDGLIAALPSLIDTLATALPTVIPQLVSTVMGLLENLMTSIVPMLFDVALDILDALVQGIANNIETLVPAAISMINQIVLSLIDHLPEILQAGFQIIEGLVNGIINNLPLIIDTIFIIVDRVLMAFAESFPQLLECGVNIVINIVTGIIQAIPQLLLVVAQLLAEILLSVFKFIGDIVGAIGDFFGKLLGIQKDKSETIAQNHKTMTTTMTADSNAMITGMNNTASNAADIENSILSSNKDMVDGVNSQNKTFTEVTSGQLKNIEKMSNVTADVVKSGTDKIHDYVTDAMDDLTMLNDYVAKPEVDASNVISKCEDIVDAVEDAISALNKLDGASGGGASISGFASGGDYEANQPFIAGELGPELIVPRTSGHVYTADETAGMLGGQSINITIQGDVYDDEASMQNKFRTAMMEVLEEQVAYG